MSSLRQLLEPMRLATWVETFGTVFSQERSERIPLGLWHQQKRFCELMEDWRSEGFQEMAMPKARQNGVSEICGELSLKDTMCFPKNKILCISGNEKKAEEFLKERFLEKYNALPRNIGIIWPKIVRQTKQHIEFDNGSEFMSLPASDTAGQGYSASGVVLDECGAIDLNNNASFDGVYRNVKPAIEKAGRRGWLMQVGTSEAGTSWNTKVKRIHEGRDNYTKMHFIGWRADPSRDEAWLEKTKQTYPNEIDFKTQYPENIKDFFVVKEGLVVPQFDESHHVAEFTPPEHFTKLYFGYDDGYRHPSVLLIAFYDTKFDHLYVYDERYWVEMDVSEKAPLIKKIIGQTEIEHNLQSKKIADSAIWQKKGLYSIADEFRRQGVTFQKAKKHGGLTSIDGSLEKMRTYFHQNKITIHPRCNNLIEDLLSWKYKKGLSETIEDIKDDGPDVLRYILQDVRQRVTGQDETFFSRTGYKKSSGYSEGGIFRNDTGDKSLDWLRS